MPCDVGEAVGEDDRVLDRLVGALPLMGHHRVRGVAHQHDAVGVPAVQRREIVQRPARADVGRADHLGHRGVPAGERVDGVADRALLHPRFVGPFRHPDDGEEVDRPATVDRVVQQMTPGTGPELKRRRVGKRGHVLDGARVRGSRPCRRTFRGPRRPTCGRITECTPSAPTTTSAAALAPSAKCSSTPRTPLLDADAPAAEVQPLAAQPVGECLQERDAVHAVVGRAERRLVHPVAPDRMVGDDLAGVPAADDERRGDDRHGLDLVAEPEPPQLARAVARQRDRGADLAQLARLLVDLEADPALAQGEREDQPTDPATDDGDLQLGHRATRSPACAPEPARSRS